MKLSAASALGQKAEKKTISPWMLWLLGIIVCYQAGYQLLVSLVLRQDRHAVDPWCASGSSTGDGSSSCIEAQLFRGWQEGVSGDLRRMHEPPIADVLQKGGEQVTMHQATVHLNSYVGKEGAPPSSPLRDNVTAVLSRTLRPAMQDGAPAANKSALAELGRPIVNSLTPLASLQSKYEAREATRLKTQAISFHKRVQLRNKRHLDSTDIQSSQTDSLVDSIAKRRRSWHAAFKAKITSVAEEFCKEPSHQQYLMCKKFFTVNATEPKAGKAIAPSGKTGGTPSLAKNTNHPLELQWRSVTQRVASPKALRGSARVEGDSAGPAVDMQKLRHARWRGHIPSVACVTVVPRGKASKVWMRYFVDNFRLQKYEGVIQIVFVYHHSDLDTAEVVHDIRAEKNGTLHIRGAAARDPEYPSPAAYRFGAWVARDADIVARWDFEAWHHPHRLSTQVRALTFSARPACLLNSWTVLDDKGKRSTVSADVRWESSFVGEAAWMRKNWYPRMEEQRGVVATHAGDLVRLSSPGLLVFHGPATV